MPSTQGPSSASCHILKLQRNFFSGFCATPGGIKGLSTALCLGLLTAVLGKPCGAGLSACRACVQPMEPSLWPSKEILDIPKSLCTLKGGSLCHRLSVWHGLVISVEICCDSSLCSATATLKKKIASPRRQRVLLCFGQGEWWLFSINKHQCLGQIFSSPMSSVAILLSINVQGGHS